MPDTRVTTKLAGAIEASLPNSIAKARDELNALKAAQRADRAEARDLRTALRDLRKGTDDYTRTQERLAAANARIENRATDIRDQSLAMRQAGMSAGGFSLTLGQVTKGLGIATAGVGVLAGGLFALNRFITSQLSKNVPNLVDQLRGLGDADDIREANYQLGIFAGNIEAGVSAGRDLAQVISRTRQQLAFNPASISQGFLRAISELGLSLDEFNTLTRPQLEQRIVARIEAVDPANIQEFNYLMGALNEVVGENTLNTLLLASSTQHLTEEQRNQLQALQEAARLEAEVNELLHELATALIPLTRDFIPLLTDFAALIRRILGATTGESVSNAVQRATGLSTLREGISDLQQLGGLLGIGGGSNTINLEQNITIPDSVDSRGTAEAVTDAALQLAAEGAFSLASGGR